MVSQQTSLISLLILRVLGLNTCCSGICGSSISPTTRMCRRTIATSDWNQCRMKYITN